MRMGDENREMRTLQNVWNELVESADIHGYDLRRRQCNETETNPDPHNAVQTSKHKRQTLEVKPGQNTDKGISLSYSKDIYPIYTVI
jgi:hypothetical protein